MGIIQKNYWISADGKVERQTLLMINEFLQCMKLEGAKDVSINEHRRMLEQFFTECRIPLGDMSSDDVLEWFISFAGDKTVRTLDLYLATLSSFFCFCKERDKVA